MVKKILGSLSVMAILVPSVMAADDFVWSNVSMGGGGFVSAIIASPVDENLFYARTDVGGAYRWNETSQKWESLMDWVDVTERGLLGIEAIAVDPVTSDKVYMVAGTSYWNDGRTAFLRSEDRGTHWTTIYTWDSTGVKGGVAQSFKAHGNGMGRGNGEALAINPSNPDIMFYGSKNKGLFKSTNNGDSWAHVNGFTTAAGYDTTWNGSGFSFVTYDPSNSNTLYAGFLREGSKSNSTFANVFTSTDGGTTWTALPIPDALRSTSGGSLVRLMPQRAVLTSDGKSLIVTFGDGAGPHTMAWDEGWGMIYDGFGRGAVLKYDVTNKVWSDFSPANLIQYDATYDVVDFADPNYKYCAPYGGISINPNNSLEMVITTEGYSGAQYWKIDGTWYDQWGTQIYYTSDGGATWYQSFKYQGSPEIEQMDANGIGWMNNSSIHWSGSVAINPFNSKQVWVTSGNGVFRTDDITNFNAGSATADTNGLLDPSGVTQNQVWKVLSHGIEETVPLEVLSIQDGPLMSVIGDYDGFRHDSVAQYPSTRYVTSLSGNSVSLGSTRDIAFAPKSGTLVKVADARHYDNEGKYIHIPSFDPIQTSTDSGRTWAAYNAYSSSIDTSYKKGSVAISADGAVVLWTPEEGTTVVHRFYNSAWTTVSGINGAYVVGDPENANVFYAYLKSTGAMYKSTDKGITFAAAGSPGVSDFKKFRVAPAREGDIWVPLAVSSTQKGGLVHSTDSGATFTPVNSEITYCEAVGFGKSATDGGYPAVYVFATIGDVTGVFQSDDKGASWTRVNDDAHEYGGLANGEFVMGDMNTYGVVYMSTAGRGIAARVPSSWNMGTSSSGSTIGIAERSVKSLSGSALAHLQGDILSLTLSGNEKVSVGLFDLRGKAILQKTVSGSLQMKLGESVPARGAYFLIVKNGSKTVLSRSVQIAR